MTRRGNGLRAQTYVPVADLAPQFADAMLDALREAGIAAYATPVTGGTGGYLDVRLPGQPTDRLYVDVAARELAREVLNERIPALREEYEQTSARGDTQVRDEEEIWREIVASFDIPFGDAQAEPPWPDRENLDDPAESAAARVIRPAEPRAADEDEGGDDDDHYVPPPPPPLPRTDTLTKLAWLALFGGPAYLLVAAMLGWDVPGWAAFTAVAAFVGGFVTLVLRMGDGPDSDSDDGAVL